MLVLNNLNPKKAFLAAIAIILLILADQTSKHFLVSYLQSQPGWLIEVSSFFDIVYSWNYGISFGLFGNYEYSNYFFIGLNSAIILALTYILLQNLDDFYFSAALIMILSGAIGNILDRIFFGAVFDFLSVHYRHLYFFPAFNLADSFISIGAGLYIIYSLKHSSNGSKLLD